MESFWAKIGLLPFRPFPSYFNFLLFTFGKFLIIEWNGWERDEDAKVVSILSHVVSDSRRIAAKSNAVTPVINPQIIPQSLKSTLEEVVTTVPKAEGEDTFESLADILVSEERPASRSWPVKYRSSVWVEDKLRGQFASIHAAMKDTVVWL